MKIAVIGAGVMGLTLAYRFGKAGHRVDVYEASYQEGGLSTWHDFGPFIWDKYYHVILRSDQHTIDLIEELGLEKELVWKETKTGFLWNGRHLSMSNHREFLQFPALTIPQKVRLGVGILYNQAIKDPKKLEGYTSAAWLQKIFGQKIYETIWEPLLLSKYGVLKDRVPAHIIWSTMQRYASTRDKSGGKEWMGHLYGTGYKVLFDALKAKISDFGGSIHCNSPVDFVSDTIAGTRYDHVVSTLPRDLIVHPFQKVPEPTFLGVIRLALVLKNPLCPYYVTNLIDRHYPFTGIIDVTNLATHSEFGEHALLMLPRYDLPTSEWFNKSDEEITHAFLAPLQATFPHIQEQILSSCVHRERRVQALWIDSPPPPPTPIRSPQGNLWSAHNELIGYNTLNNNSVIEVANKVSEDVLACNEE